MVLTSSTVFLRVQSKRRNVSDPMTRSKLSLKSWVPITTCSSATIKIANRNSTKITNTQSLQQTTLLGRKDAMVLLIKIS